VLDLPDGTTAAAIDAAYRELAATAHPDRGGSDAAMARLNLARDQARQSLAG
jgi:curved DNA-binding protein CbpA